MSEPSSTTPVPVLFLVFNRIMVTRKAFEAIRTARPKRLYVAADGPRKECEGEQEKVEKVRKIVEQVDWNCEVRTLFRKENLGCKKAVSSAISWFFEHETEGIILEDDCVPDQSFFPFCQELLSRYRCDTRVMAISGNNFQEGFKRTDDSYYFSRYPHCWGWATWKRAWTMWDGDLSTWPEVRKENRLADISGGHVAFENYWSDIFNKCYNDKIDSWAFPWTYTSMIQRGLTILPNVNLVSNIGFGPDATHTKDKNSHVSNLPAFSVKFPLKHPRHVIRCTSADQLTDKKNFGISNEKLSRLNIVIRIVKRVVYIIFEKK